MTTFIMPSAGQPFNVEQNKVRGSEQATWTAIADDDNNKDRGILVHGVLWSGSSAGEALQIRDREGDVWYQQVSTGGHSLVDEFTSGRPLYTKFEYYDSEGSNIIIIYGTYI